MNQFLNDPTAQTRGGGSSGGSFSGTIAELADDHDINSIISGMSQRDLMQLFGGIGSNTSNLPALLGTAMNSRSGGNRTARQEEPMDTDVPVVQNTGVVSGGGTGSGTAVAPPTAQPSTPSLGKGSAYLDQIIAIIFITHKYANVWKKIYSDGYFCAACNC